LTTNGDYKEKPGKGLKKRGGEKGETVDTTRRGEQRDQTGERDQKDFNIISAQVRFCSKRERHERKKFIGRSEQDK